MEAKVVIANKAGIHARPASMLVQSATKFQSKIKLAAKGKTIDAKSILMIMSLGLVKGTEVVISAEGADADAAVKAIKDLVESKFGEE
ncbi:MAG: Phosphotransferase System HPr (HPr) Family [Massilibacillus sp.]|jgi:phosphocarrier protein|nr:Phosphotransferase System HPr (HPr) Family [Massilibacillus sp.]